MGKSSYLGGSTIFHGGSSFFSKDRDSKRSRVINAEKDFLLKCVRAELTGCKYPLSYSEHKKLHAAVTKAGSVSDWLKKHPDYKNVKDREIKKQQKRTAEIQKKKARKIAVKNKEGQGRNKKNQAKHELDYLKNFVWAQIIGRPPPQNQPKGFRTIYKTGKDLLNWATGHDKYAEVYQEMTAKRKKQLAKFDKAKKQTIETITKKDIHK